MSRWAEKTAAPGSPGCGVPSTWPGPKASASPLPPWRTIANAPRRGASTRATGQVSAQDQAFTRGRSRASRRRRAPAGSAPARPWRGSKALADQHEAGRRQSRAAAASRGRRVARCRARASRSGRGPPAPSRKREARGAEQEAEQHPQRRSVAVAAGRPWAAPRGREACAGLATVAWARRDLDARAGRSSAAARVARLASAEHLVEVPAGRQVERHVGAGEALRPSGALGVLSTATRLVRRLTRRCSSASVSIALSASPERDRGRASRATSASAILRRAQSFDDALALAPRRRAAASTGQGWPPILPLIVSVPSTLDSLRRDHQRLAAIEVGQHRRRHVRAACRRSVRVRSVTAGFSSLSNSSRMRSSTCSAAADMGEGCRVRVRRRASSDRSSAPSRCRP